MIKSTEDIIYNRIKNSIGFHRSKKFMKFIGDQNPSKILHHCFGSYSQSKKTSDYTVIPLTPEEHEKAEKDKSQYAIDNLHIILKQLIDYIEKLEAKK